MPLQSKQSNIPYVALAHVYIIIIRKKESRKKWRRGRKG
jgi:hypothetical protein